MKTAIPTSSILRGYRYDTPLTKYCRRFHPCTFTQKCQNYDAGCRECFLCEQRVRAIVGEEGKTEKRYLGGWPAERKYVPDLQLSLKIISEYLNTSFVAPTKRRGTVTGSTLSADYDNSQMACKNMQAHYSRVTVEDV